LFATPSSWLLLGGLQFIFAWYFLARMNAFLQVQAQLAQLANAPGATLAVATPLFASLALIFMMLVPAFSMRLFAEERRNQTMALLLSAPVSSTHIVLGKFIGLLIFLLMIVASCTLMVLSLAAGTLVDYGLVFCNVLGLSLLVASYTALGLYISSLTVQPVVAALAALAVLFGLWLVEISMLDADYAWRMFAPSSHFSNFNIGLLSSTDLVYFALFCLLFLLMTIRRVDNNRVYG